MIWSCLNVMLSSVVGAVVAVSLFRWPEAFNCPQRVGLGLLGAGCVMTIGPIMIPQGSPFESWSASLFRLGCAIFFIGWMKQRKTGAGV